MYISDCRIWGFEGVSRLLDTTAWISNTSHFLTWPVFSSVIAVRWLFLLHSYISPTDFVLKMVLSGATVLTIETLSWCRSHYNRVTAVCCAKLELFNLSWITNTQRQAEMTARKTWNFSNIACLQSNNNSTVTQSTHSRNGSFVSFIMCRQDVSFEVDSREGCINNSVLLVSEVGLILEGAWL